MGASQEFKTHAELDADSDFIQYLEALLSGTPDTGTGVNRPLGRLARNTDAILDVLQSGRMASFVTGGGNISWNGTTLQWTSNITINMWNEVGGAIYNTIAAGTRSFAAPGYLMRATLNRTNNSTINVYSGDTLISFMASYAGSPDRLDAIPLALRDGNDIILWDGRRLRSGMSFTNNGYTDTQYGQQSELTTVHSNQKENLKLILTGGGNISWDSGTRTFTWSSNLTVAFPSSPGNNYMAPQSVVIAPGSTAYITLSRAPTSGVLRTVSVATAGAVPTTDDTLVLATHNSDDGRLYLWNGTALSDGETILLGGLRSGVQFSYRKAGANVQVTDLTESGAYPSRSYPVGSGALMVYRNGIKAKGSSAIWRGTYPSTAGGGLSGSIDLDDEYLEEDTGDGTGNRIIWIADGQVALEPVFHSSGTHSPAYVWPQSDEFLEAFTGLQGQGPSPVESMGIFPEPGAGPLEGTVRLKSGAGIALAYDLPNNAITISASVSAGVSSLTAGSGGNVLTGAVTVQAGTGISISNPSGSILQIANSISTLDALSDVGANLSASLRGNASASSTNIVVLSKDIPQVNGFDKVWTVDGTTIKTAKGSLVIGNATYRHTTGSALTCTTSNMFGTETLSNGWYGLYLGPGPNPASPTPGGNPSLALSGLFPVSAAPGVHPSNPTYCYLAPVYVDSGSFYPFTKVDGMVYMGREYNITSAFAGFPSASYVPIDVLTAINLRNKTWPSMVRLRILLTGNGTGRGTMSYIIWRSGAFTSGHTARTIIANNDQAIFEIDTVIGANGIVNFLIDSAQSWATVSGVWMIAFGDGRATVANGLGG